MTQEEIEQLIKEQTETLVDKKLKQFRFENFNTPRHEHNGKDSPRINQADIVPGNALAGKIEFATSGRRYKLKLTFNPTQVLFNGVATNDTDFALIVGCARITNGGAYLQPDTPDSVQPGTPFPVVQNSSGIWGGTLNTSAPSEGHIARAQRSGVIYASLTIPGGGFSENNFPTSTQYDKPYENGVLFLDFYCASGWYIIGNFTIS